MLICVAFFMFLKSREARDKADETMANVLAERHFITQKAKELSDHMERLEQTEAWVVQRSEQLMRSERVR